MRSPYTLLLSLALLGHVALCVAVLNRAHAVGIPRWLVKLLSLAAAIWAPLLPALMWLEFQRSDWPLEDWLAKLRGTPVADYAVVCWLVGILVIGRWFGRIFGGLRTKYLLDNHTQRYDIAEAFGHRPTGTLVGRMFAMIPGNESWTIHLQEKRVRVPRLDPALDELSILHLSDLHFTGRIGKEYFQEVVRLANASQPDLIALTGDFVDAARCIDWIPETLGKLHAPLGVYFVLGNHDPRVRQTPRLRKTLVDSGAIDLSGRWLKIDVPRVGAPPLRSDSRSTILNSGTSTVILAGNELPWFAPAPDMRNCPTTVDGKRPLRLLLTHTPDLIGWARRHDFDLMLSGHNHGGQWCIPGIGPVLCPSRYGVRFAGGVFYQRPTLLHVSRGVSAQTPLRWNCPPEAAKLILRAT